MYLHAVITGDVEGSDAFRIREGLLKFLRQKKLKGRVRMRSGIRNFEIDVKGDNEPVMVLVTHVPMLNGISDVATEIMDDTGKMVHSTKGNTN